MWFRQAGPIKHWRAEFQIKFKGHTVTSGGCAGITELKDKKKEE